MEHFMWGLMDHSSRNTEGSDTEGDLNCRGLGQKLSEEKNFGMLPGDCSCFILLKNVAGFCHCLKSLPEDEVKSFRSVA